MVVMRSQQSWQKPAWFHFGGFFRQKLKTGLIRHLHRHGKIFIPTFLTKLYRLSACLIQRARTAVLVGRMKDGPSALCSTATQPRACCALALTCGPASCCLPVPGGRQVSSAKATSQGNAEHRVPSSTHSKLQETGVGSHQHRGTLRGTTSPSCEAIVLIEHDLAQQTQLLYLVLSHALQLKLHSRRNEDKDVDCIRLVF